MSRRRLTLACGSYDRAQPLADGRVGVEGVELNLVALRPGEAFWRMLNNDYPVEGSRPTLEALVAYAREQGLTEKKLPIEALFAPNIRPEIGQYLHATGEDRRQE